MLVDNFVLKQNYGNEISECIKKRDWQKILGISKKYGFNVTYEFMWCYPTRACIDCLKILFKNLNIQKVLSIGCGSGLMEFVISESLGVKINGLEVDKHWWSRHETFIPISFLASDQIISSKFLLDSNLSKNWNFALMFCYFNNREAFNDYIKAYDGNWVIIIGPAERTGRYTEPLPLDKDLEEKLGYKLVHFCEFGDNKDIIAIYEKKMKKY